jgi:predicted metal-dependent hydrolase
LKIDDINIDLVRKKIKNMHLSVYPPDGRVRIAVPLEVDDEAIRLFVISKLSWIKRNRRKFENQERQTPRIFADRESHYFEGKRYLLRVTEHEASPKVELKTKTYIDLFVRPDTTTDQRQSILNEWYRKELKKQIPLIIGKWEMITGITVNDWGVRQMKTKWGTCSIEDKLIRINLELAKKPAHCLEYIILHEMIHLLERHHNNSFFSYLEKYMPQWKSYKEELNSMPVSHGEWTY